MFCIYVIVKQLKVKPEQHSNIFVHDVRMINVIHNLYN